MSGFLHRHTHTHTPTLPLSLSGSRLVGKSSISLPNTARAVKWGKGWKRKKKGGECSLMNETLVSYRNLMAKRHLCKIERS